ncbi:xanthine dehydrogenase subunit D [Peribacillus kribbensis]|uniref:xanthine dehydrogenase subunit D n=1 Tax=Peribacillus kribbensis TaxID=356658 RepID=UPI0003F4D257|nr:xanthine dehydrogenase subunit D [Peribacillus kribbensis]
MLAAIEGKGRIRPDGLSKVTGSLKYLTDLSFEGMLYGKVLRSEHPHARITSIHTEKAQQLKGVAAVITHEDIPGLNGFGLIFPDQPVLCDTIVRYTGDAIAAVAAETEEIAEQALSLIEVGYEPLAVVDDPEKALLPHSPKLHPDGNLLHQTSYIQGDIEHAFHCCCFLVEETYELPRQMHAYMETEGGVVVPEENGGITVFMGTQHGYKDRFQLSRILDIPEERIRVISSPMGGSFGGKDELNVQPHASLLALKTGRPVKIHQTREESLRAGLKRHPMKITMKTGIDEQGLLLAHQVRILADTGAYSSLGPAVLDFAVEHAAGPYLIPHVKTEGFSVFTNNGVSGEFRGFGGNQVTFALESQMDRLAELIDLSPLEIRKRNVRRAEDRGPMGQRIAPANGAADVLESIDRHKDEIEKAAQPADSATWIKRGTGMALTMHGGGLGYGRLDGSGGRLEFSREGKIEVYFGFEECGQGLLSVIETIVTDELQCAPSDMVIVIGDTARVPHTGSSTASRATSMVWNALQRMKGEFSSLILQLASDVSGISVHELKLGEGGIWKTYADETLPFIHYRDLAENVFSDPITVSTIFDFPTTPDPVPGGHFLYAFAAVLAEVEVNLLTGKITVTRLDQAVAAGPVISRLGYLGQIEGGGVMALGYTLMEDAAMEEGLYIPRNFDSYLIPTIKDVPLEMNVEAIEDLYDGDIYGPRGVGEIGTVAAAPAITKAIHSAMGHWITKLPVSPEEILSAVNERGLLSWKRNK